MLLLSGVITNEKDVLFVYLADTLSIVIFNRPSGIKQPKHTVIIAD